MATFTTATSKSLGSKLLPMALPFFPMTIAKINNWSAATCATDGFTVVAAALFALVFVVRGSASGHFFFSPAISRRGSGLFRVMIANERTSTRPRSGCCNRGSPNCCKEFHPHSAGLIEWFFRILVLRGFCSLFFTSFNPKYLCLVIPVTTHNVTYYVSLGLLMFKIYYAGLLWPTLKLSCCIYWFFILIFKTWPNLRDCFYNSIFDVHCSHPRENFKLHKRDVT